MSDPQSEPARFDLKDIVANGIFPKGYQVASLQGLFHQGAKPAIAIGVKPMDCSTDTTLALLFSVTVYDVGDLSILGSMGGILHRTINEGDLPEQWSFLFADLSADLSKKLPSAQLAGLTRDTAPEMLGAVKARSEVLVSILYAPIFADLAELERGVKAYCGGAGFARENLRGGDIAVLSDPAVNRMLHPVNDVPLHSLVGMTLH